MNRSTVKTADMLNTSSTSGDQLFRCPSSHAELFITFGMMGSKAVLVLPLSVFVLHLAHEQWRRQRSFKPMSHSDVFTYHLALIELFWGLGIILYLFSSDNLVMMILGIGGFSVTFFGEIFFHMLTCVERHLAVVHPVTYLSLRNARGVRIRNISVGCVWLLSFGLACCHVDVLTNRVLVVMLLVLVISIIVVTFCSLSVLCVLVRPGPGGGVREKVDQSKQRAFHTITAISAVLWLWFAGLLVCYSLSISSVLSKRVDCLLNISVSLFNLPTALVSPLFYLSKAGKLKCNWNKPE